MSVQVSEPLEPAVRVARGASYLLIQGVVIYLTGIIYFAYATRILPTVAEFGRITTINIFSLLMVAVGALGLPTAGTRFIAKYIAGKQEENANSVYRTLLACGAVLSIIVLVVTVALAKSFSTFLLGSSDYTFLFELAGFDIFFQLLTLFPLGALQGVYGFKENAVVNTISNVVQFSSALYFLSVGLGIEGIMYGWIIGDGLGAVLALAIAARSFTSKARGEPIRKLLRFSLPVYGSGLVAYAANYMDRFLVLFFAGTAALGLYAPAVTAASTLGIVSVALTSALLPQLTELHTKHGDAGIRDASRFASRYLFLLFLPLSVGLAVTAGPTITVFAGPKYSGGAAPLAVLALGWGLTSASVIINSALLALGRTRVLLFASIVGISGLFVFAPLIGPLGVAGAAFARVALLLASLGVSWLITNKQIPGIVDTAAFYRILACALVEGTIVFVVETVWYDLLALPVYVAVGFLSYTLSLRLFRVLGSNDIMLARRFLPIRLHFLVDIFDWLVAAG